VFRESPQKVFARVSDHASLGDWIPLVQKITVDHPHKVPPGESTVGTARHISMKGGLEIVETVVYWNPPHCYAYKAEGRHLPFRNYIGLLQVVPIDEQSGKLIFREYFDGTGIMGEAILPHGVAAVFHNALGNLARSIGGTEYAMTTVSHL
jgi:Polyketide cyclase / dehydrase and lipid transport.